MLLKVKLKPKQIKSIDMVYINDLKKICNEFINKNNATETQIEDLHISSLVCDDFEILEKNIIFKENVCFYIKSNSYELILKLVQGFFHAGSIFLREAEFDILGMEIIKSNLVNVNV